jgi:hypothetical protein
MVRAKKLWIQRIARREPTRCRIVISGTEVVEAEVWVVLFAAIEIVVGRRAARGVAIAKRVVFVAISHGVHLKVFFSQHGTRGVIWVYVDLDGFAFVGIRPGIGIFLTAKITAVVTHLLVRILVDVG